MMETRGNRGLGSDQTTIQQTTKRHDDTTRLQEPMTT
jgi:hypothetical protein